MGGWSEAVFWLLCFTLTGINLVFGGLDEPCEIEASFTGQGVARLINVSVHIDIGSILTCQCENVGEEEFKKTLWRGPDGKQITRKQNSNSTTMYRKVYQIRRSIVRAILTITERFSCMDTGEYSCQISKGNTREFLLTPSGETCIPQNVNITAVALSTNESGTTLNITCTADNPLPQIYELSYSWRINNVSVPSEKGKAIVVTVKGNPIVTCSVSNLVGTSSYVVQLIIQTTQPTSVLPTAFTTTILMSTSEATLPLLTTSAEPTSPMLTTAAEPTSPLLTTSAEPTSPMLTTSAELTSPLLTTSAEPTSPLLTTAAEPTSPLLTTSAEPTLLFSSVLTSSVPYNLTAESTTLLTAAPPTTFLPTASPTTFLSIATSTPVPINTSFTSSVIETIPPPFAEVNTSTVIEVPTSSIIETSIPTVTEATTSAVIELSTSSIIETSITTVIEATGSAIIEPSLPITKSTPSTTMQPTPTTQPEPITIEPLQQSATNKSVNITLSWSLSETPIGNQTVMYTWTSLWANRVAKRDSSNRESVTVTKDATSHTVVDADGFSTYCFSISAEFSNSNYTTDVKCDETEPTQPSEPINVQVLSHYGDSAWVSWEIPQRPNGIITLFQVYINDNPDKQLEYGQYVTRKGVRVYNLQEAATYTFEVSAINQAGEGLPSQAVSYTHRALQRSQGLPPLSSGVVAALIIIIITAFLLWLIIFGCIIFIYLKKKSESGSQDHQGVQIVSEEKGGEGSYVKTTASKDDYVDSEDVDTKEPADETKNSEKPEKSQEDEEETKKNTPSASEEGPEAIRKDPLNVEVETEMVTVKFDDDSSDDPATSQRRFYSDTAV